MFDVVGRLGETRADEGEEEGGVVVEKPLGASFGATLGRRAQRGDVRRAAVRERAGIMQLGI